MHAAMVALFIMTAGLTASGIVANLYRLLLPKTLPKSQALHLAVMVFAGPSVLFDNAARARQKKQCSYVAFGLAAALAAYWSILIGTLVVSVALAI